MSHGKNVCDVMWVHAYIQCSQLITRLYIAICDDIIIVLIVGLRSIEGCAVG